jgi:hypothetical protein
MVSVVFFLQIKENRLQISSRLEIQSWALRLSLNTSLTQWRYRTVWHSEIICNFVVFPRHLGKYHDSTLKKTTTNGILQAHDLY